MAELTPMERLQPCLLDRLTDDAPDVHKESRDQRIISLRRYKHAVVRDLGLLLNSRSRPDDDPIYDFEEASNSVLNYGIPNLCGTHILNIRTTEIEAKIRQSISCFEPRISQNSISVRLICQKDSEYIRTVSFEIEGELWAQPLPDHLFIKTEVDLETGHHSLKGESNG